MLMKETLFKLTQVPGVSGNEREAGLAAAEVFGTWCETTVDRNGNMAAALRGTPQDAAEHVLVDAHLDEIGMIVTGIYEAGFVSCAPVGGVLGRGLLGSEVIIHGREDVYGVFGATPPHLQKADEKKGVDMDKATVDTGFTGERLKERIALGDSVTFVGKPKELLNGRLMSKAMDDRSCCAIMARAAELLAAEPPRCRVTFVCSVNEEVTASGAATAAFAAAPTRAVALDVTFAKEPGSPEKTISTLGSGPAIGIAPTLNRAMFERMKALADENGIPYTVEVMHGNTATNSEAIARSRGGVPTSLLSLPLRYMHTPGEICDEADIEATAKLVAAYIRSL